MTIITYLIENKDWLFSGVGVVIIGGALTLFRVFFNNRKTSLHSVPASEPQSIEQRFADLSHVNDKNIIDHFEKKSCSKCRLESSNDKSVSHITVKDIIDEIHSLPPFQQQSAEKNYNGIIVEWSGRLWNVEKMGYPNENENIVKVEFHPHSENSHYRVLLRVDIRDYPELKIIKRDSEIIAKGKIVYSSGEGMYVRLDPIEITFNQK